jgi:hypothetical protein
MLETLFSIIIAIWLIRYLSGKGDETTIKIELPPEGNKPNELTKEEKMKMLKEHLKEVSAKLQKAKMNIKRCPICLEDHAVVEVKVGDKGLKFILTCGHFVQEDFTFTDPKEKP